MSNMEFTWRMVGTLIWPIVVLAGLIAYRRWITEKLGSLRVKAGGFEGEVQVLNAKVDTIGRDMATTLSEISQPTAEDEIPTSLVDLIPLVTWNRSEGLHTAFTLVLRALKSSHPQLSQVRPSQLAQAMQGLVDKNEIEADVVASVRQLQELLEMPEWKSDQIGDTRGLAFLMLAEGAIHEILRTAQHPAAIPNGGAATGATVPLVRSSWRGRYDDRFSIELQILGWNGTQFSGLMTYPDDGTTTLVSGQAVGQAGSASVDLSWKEQDYALTGQRPIDFKGSYSATVTGDRMDAVWRKGNQPIVRFTMTPAEPSS